MRRLLGTWFAFLGFIPTIYDMVSTYLPKPWRVYQFQDWVLFAFPAASLFLAAFRVWREQRQETFGVRAELDLLRAAQPDFEVTAFGWGILSEIGTYAQLAQQRLDGARTGLTQRKSRDRMTQYFSTFGGDTVSAWERYVEKLEQYLKELEDLKEVSDRCARVTFRITNVGSKFDEDVHVRLLADSDARFLDVKKIRFDNIPEEPREISIPRMRDFSSRIAPQFRNVITISEDVIEAELRSLRAKESADILYDGVYVGGTKACDIRYEVSSRATQRPIQKAVRLDLPTFIVAKVPEGWPKDDE